MSWMQCGETLERGDRGCRIRHPAVHLGAAVCAPNLNKPKHLAPEGGQPSWNVAVAHPLAMRWRDLRERDVTHVVMEASGVYTEPVYYALMEQDFEQVAVINPAHAKALKGHKTDAKDALRLAELFECGCCAAVTSRRRRSRTCGT